MVFTMTLRRKTMLLIGGVELLALALFWWVSSSLIMGRFEQLEKDGALRNIERAKEALEFQLARMDMTARDWAWWDDTAAFVEDGNEAYQRSNLSDRTFEGIGIDLIAFLDAMGRHTYVTGYNAAAGVKTDVPAGFLEFMASDRAALSPSTITGDVRGLLALPEGAMALVVRNILDSEGRGPSNGRLIMGRWVNRPMASELARLIHLDMHIHSRGSAKMTSVMKDDQFDTASDSMVRARDVAHMDVFGLLRDLRGEAALLLHIVMPRPAHVLALQTQHQYLLAVIAMAAALFILTAGAMGRFVTERLERLGSDVAAIAASGDSGARLDIPGSDEIASLADDVNHMLASLERSESEVHALNAELEQRVKQRTGQLEAANKELEAFAYSVSHDLRAPLRGIDGFSQAVLDEAAGRVPEGVMDHLRRVRAAAQRMGRLIDGLLMLSRLTRKELRLQRVDLSGLARSIVQEFQKSAPGRSVSVVIQDGVVCEGDPELLRIVLQNLLENAWKFSSGKSESTIEFGITSGAMGERVCFVRDDGAGFDMQYAGKLFGAFQRLHAPNEFEGTGLGLATVQRIIHRHGGRVWAEAEVNKGAVFYFTL